MSTQGEIPFQMSPFKMSPFRASLITQKISGTKKWGFLEGFFLQIDASLGWGALSAKCAAGSNLLGNLVSLGMTMDSGETPFAKTPFPLFLKFAAYATASELLQTIREVELTPEVHPCAKAVSARALPQRETNNIRQCSEA